MLKKGNIENKIFDNFKFQPNVHAFELFIDRERILCIVDSVSEISSFA